jgi:hypothetical protein
VLPNRFLEKPQRGFLVAMGGEEEIDGLAVPVDGAVEVFPLAFDLDVRLIHPPALADQALSPFPESGLPFQRELLNSAVDVRIIDHYPRSAIISSRFR